MPWASLRAVRKLGFSLAGRGQTKDLIGKELEQVGHYFTDYACPNS